MRRRLKWCIRKRNKEQKEAIMKKLRDQGNIKHRENK